MGSGQSKVARALRPKTDHFQDAISAIRVQTQRAPDERPECRSLPHRVELGGRLHPVSSFKKFRLFEALAAFGMFMSEANVRRFRVAVSYSGDEEARVESVAYKLAKHFGRDQVFYYRFFPDELARLDLDVYLQNIYSKDSDILALFFSDGYTTARWCGLEWRAIRNLIGKRSSHIIPIQLQQGPLPEGLFDTDGFLPALKMSPEEIAQSIIRRYNREFSNSTTFPEPSPQLAPAVVTEGSKRRKRQIELVLDADYSSFGKDEDAALLRSIKALLDGDYEVRILSKKPGSIRIVVEADEPLARAILRVANQGYLGHFLVTSCKDLSVMGGVGGTKYSQFNYKDRVKLWSFLDSTLIVEAAKVITNPYILINLVRKRIQEFSRGKRPLVPTNIYKSPANIALEEIIGGWITFSYE